MIKNILIFFLLFKVIFGQDLTAYEVMDRVYSIPKPKTSIMEIRLEITRKKRDKEKTKVREFTRYEKYYEKGKYRSKSMARFNKPNVVKGTGLLSWSQRNGQTDQWFFLPKLKTAKKVKGKDKSNNDKTTIISSTENKK